MDLLTYPYEKGFENFLIVSMIVIFPQSRLSTVILVVLELWYFMCPPNSKKLSKGPSMNYVVSGGGGRGGQKLPILLSKRMIKRGEGVKNCRS